MKSLRERQLEAEITRLEKLVYVPGLWRCAKCDFSILQSNLNARDGTITARDEPGDKCPNCDSPLWRVTERQAGNDMIDRCEEQIVRAKDAEEKLERAMAALQQIAAMQAKEMAGVARTTLAALDTPAAGEDSTHG